MNIVCTYTSVSKFRNVKNSLSVKYIVVAHKTTLTASVRQFKTRRMTLLSWLSINSEATGRLAWVSLAERGGAHTFTLRL